MKKKKKIILLGCLVILLGCFLIINLFNKDTYAHQDIIDNINLIYDDNISDEDIYQFIDEIDDIVIPYSSYNISNNLNENYDFLVTFAIKFIEKNKQYYQDKIINEEYQYGEYKTNKYIDLEEIYLITNSVFGQKDFYIINDYLEVKDNKLPLLEPNERNFMMKLTEIKNKKKIDNIITVEANYQYQDNNITYLYTFELINNKMILKNISL